MRAPNVRYLFPLTVNAAGVTELVGDPLQYGPIEEVEPAGFEERKGFAQMAAVQFGPNGPEITGTEIISGEGDFPHQDQERLSIGAVDARTLAMLGLGGAAAYLAYRQWGHPAAAAQAAAAPADAAPASYDLASPSPDSGGGGGGGGPISFAPSASASPFAPAPAAAMPAAAMPAVIPGPAPTLPTPGPQPSATPAPDARLNTFRGRGQMLDTSSLPSLSLPAVPALPVQAPVSAAASMRAQLLPQTGRPLTSSLVPAVYNVTRTQNPSGATATSYQAHITAAPGTPEYYAQVAAARYAAASTPVANVTPARPAPAPAPAPSSTTRGYTAPVSTSANLSARAQIRGVSIGDVVKSPVALACGAVSEGFHVLGDVLMTLGGKPRHHRRRPGEGR